MTDAVMNSVENIEILENEQKVHRLNALSRKEAISSPKEALRFAEEAHGLAVKLGYKRGIAESLLMIGYASRGLSNYGQSIPGLLEALDIYSNIGDKQGQMKVLNLLGISYFYLAGYEQALDNFKKSLDLSIELKDKNLEASTLNNIGEIYRELGKPEESLDYFNNAMKMSEALGIKHNMAVISMNIGHIHNSTLEYGNALRFYKRSLEICQEIHDNISKGELLTKIGEIHEKLNKKEEALGYYKESLTTLEKCGNGFYQIDTLICLGNYYIKQKLYDTGIDYLNKALELSEHMNAGRKAYNAHLLLAECYEVCGEHTKALSHYKKYHDLERQVLTDNLEEKLKIIIVEHKLDKLEKEAEIYRLRNVELKEKNEEIESKISQLAITNEKLSEEITKRIELQAHLEQANKKLEHLSYIDELTEIPNRRIFNEVIRKQWNQCREDVSPLSVILLDIDYFKNYNDNYGHLQGDECLRKVAKALAGCVKHSYDFIGRFGGEEFGIILPGTGYEAGIMLAEQMRISVEALRIKHEDSSIGPYITISLGVATVLPQKHMDFHELINASDKQLYKAKNEGRNRVCATNL